LPADTPIFMLKGRALDAGAPKAQSI